ncbi:YybH family protein [Acetobacterium bakii]|uniref:DUF4440 domain-containing protein n=1 Tax=Acetobacterium bakii TaxID=52689 RepID=A0A0L6U0N1_9FIRM|nr:nuclear transport factor 2 family protein [Acetobacterium bakii]KNZ42074.1 hypothetical protein AKG39_08565 [Acetobacterium bakii]
METIEKQLINNLENSFHDAWANGDAREIASFFTDDGFRVGPDGTIQHGRSELEEAFAEMFKMMPDATLTFEPGTIRLLSPEYATWQGGVEITLGEGKPSIKGYALDLLKKVDEHWLIQEAHPKTLGPLAV